MSFFSRVYLCEKCPKIPTGPERLFSLLQQKKKNNWKNLVLFWTRQNTHTRDYTKSGPLSQDHQFVFSLLNSMDQVTLLPGAAFDYDMPCALRVARDRCWDDPLCGWCADLTAPQENQTRFAGKCYQACQWIWDASKATSGVGGLNTFDPELDGRCPIQHQQEWQLRPDGTTCMIADAVQGYMTMVTLLTALFFVRAFLEFVGSFSCCSACSCCAPSGMGKGTGATAKPGDGAQAIKTRRLFILCWILTHSLLYASLVRYQVSNRSQHRPQDVISAIALLLQARTLSSLIFNSLSFL